MEFEEKREICEEEMTKEFGVTKKQASKLIGSLDLEDIVFDRYKDAINEKEEEKHANWDYERKLNPDLM